ncbi:MAG: fibronectin type III domain-containing protein, partial [candidate division WOR-3 bacterium]
LGTLQEAKIKIPFLGIWYGVGVTYNNPYQITLGKRGDIWDPDSGTVLTHEWSHGLQVSVLGNKIPYGEIIEDHWERTVSNHGHAFREGFAEFNELAMWIEEFGQNLTDTTKKREEFYQPLDTLYFPYYRGSKLDYPNTDGSIVEGSVMQFFWDLFDDKNTNDHSINFDDDGVYGGIYKVIYTLESLKNIMTEGVSIWEKKGEEEDSVKFKYKAYRFPGGNDDFIGKYKDKWQELGYGNVTELYYVDVHPFNYLEPYPVPAPTNFMGSVSENTCILSWSDNAQNEGAYILKRRKEGENMWQTFISPQNIGSYSDVGLEPNKTYYYKLAALTCDTSQWAGPIQVTTLALNPPTNLSANSYSPYTSVILKWNDNSNYEEGYEIWRKGINENWHCIYPYTNYPTQGQGTGQIEWIDNSVSQFKDYFYKVRAYKDGIYSNFSDSVWVTTSPIIATKNVNLCVSSGKNIIRVGNTIHIVYSKDGKIYYTYSNDNGLSWSTPETISGSGIALNPTLTYDGSKIWVAFEDVVSGVHHISYAKRNSQNNWSIKHDFKLGFNPSIIYVQNKGIYLGFADSLSTGKYGPPQINYSKVCLYKINDNLNAIRIGCDSIGEGVYLPHFSLGKVKENGEEKVIMIYNLNNLKCITEERTPYPLIVYDKQTWDSWQGIGISPFIGNENLACFISDGKIKVIKYDEDWLCWVWYPDFNSQNSFTEGENPQILYESDMSSLIFEKDKQIYLQKIINTPLPPLKKTLMPEYNKKLKPNFILRREPLRIYAEIIHSLNDSLLIFRRYPVGYLIPPPVATIDEGIPIFDVPPNNSKRLFIKNDTLHILYSKNSLIYDAILKDSLIKKIFLGYGKNPAGFLYKNNLYSIWAYNDTTTLEKIEFTK